METGSRQENASKQRIWPHFASIEAEKALGRISDVPIGVLCRTNPLTKLFRGDEARADKFALAPDQRTYPKNLAARGEGKAEQLRDRQRADIKASAAIGDLDDQAFDPRRVGRRDQKSLLLQIDPDILACAEVLAVSRHGSPPRGKAYAKMLQHLLPKKVNIYRE